MDDFLPYQIARLATGPVRVVHADPDTEPAPTKIQDIVAMKTPYAPAAGWTDFGAMVNPGSYSRSNTQNNLSLQNETSPIETEVTEVSRSLAFNVAELSEHALQILEQAPTVETIAAAIGAGAQKGLEFGGFDELDYHRVAFIGRRRKTAGLVLETAGGLERGRMFAVVLYYAAIAGDAQTVGLDRAAYASQDVSVQAYDDPVVGKHGRWIFEDAGTLT